jgi:hypothetical protein
VFTALSSLTHLGLRVEPSVLDAALLSEIACLPRLLSLTLEGGVADDILPPLQRLLAGPSGSGAGGRRRGLARLQLPAPERWGEAVLAVRFLPSALVGLESLSAYRANLQVSWGPACQASFASFCQPAASRVGARSPDTAPLEQSSYLTTCPFLHMCWPPRCSWVPIQVPPLLLA